MKMRKAVSADIGQILAITDSARRFQRQCGFRQWEDGYPAYDNIAADIAAEGAYVFENEGIAAESVKESAVAEGTSADIAAESVWNSKGESVANKCVYNPEKHGIIAYAYLSEGDAEYDRLSEIWHYPGSYGVIHRLAIAPHFRGQGLAADIFALSETHLAAQGIRAMRVDTGRDNIVMQRILSRAGYTCRGLRHFAWGPRLAYEKPLP